MYRLVRYEDLVAAPLEVMEQLYQFLGIPVSPAMREQVYLHFHAEQSNDSGKIYGTFRSSNYQKPGELPEYMNKSLQEHCKSFMKTGKYL